MNEYFLGDKANKEIEHLDFMGYITHFSSLLIHIFRALCCFLQQATGTQMLVSRSPCSSTLLLPPTAILTTSLAGEDGTKNINSIAWVTSMADIFFHVPRVQGASRKKFYQFSFRIHAGHKLLLSWLSWTGSKKLATYCSFACQSLPPVSLEFDPFSSPL